MGGRYLGYGWTDDTNDPDDFYLRNGNDATAQHISNSFAVMVEPIERNQSPRHLSFLSGGTINSLESASILFTHNSWHSLEVFWRYANRVDASGGFIMEVFWMGDLMLRENYDSYVDLGLSDPIAVWGISAGVDWFWDWNGAGETKIQFISMENGNNINIPHCEPQDVEINLVWEIPFYPSPTLADPPRQPIVDSLLRDQMNCCSPFIFGDTITNKIKCVDPISAYIEISGLDMTNSEWYIDDEKMPYSAFYDNSSGKWKFLWMSFSYIKIQIRVM